MTNFCTHANTKIWEPHLAGARKCLDCKRVKSSGSSHDWYFEGDEKKMSEDERSKISNALYACILEVLQPYETRGFNSHVATQRILEGAISQANDWIARQL